VPDKKERAAARRGATHFFRPSPTSPSSFPLPPLAVGKRKKTRELAAGGGRGDGCCTEKAKAGIQGGKRERERERRSERASERRETKPKEYVRVVKGARGDRGEIRAMRL